MDMKEMLTQAMGLATSINYLVKIDSEEFKEMTYLELGLFITTKKIDTIEIKTRD